MSDFENVKKNLIETNEKNYGQEIKEKYGEEVYETTNDILNNLTEDKWLYSEKLRKEVEDTLRNLTPAGDYKCAEAVEMAKKHGKWASIFWAEGAYSPEAHLTLVQMYTDDERFTAYYDAIVKGGALFLRKAVENALDSHALDNGVIEAETTDLSARSMTMN